MKLCLHIHSCYSKDSKSRIEDILSVARELQYDIISITDHNTVQGSLEAVKLRQKDIRIITGAEFSTQIGHILAYSITETVEKVTKKLDQGVFDYFDLIHHIREEGGMAFLAHPMNSKAALFFDELRLLDGIEGYNSRIDSFRRDKKTDQFIEDCRNQYNLIVIGAPDAHSLKEMKNCYMEVEAPKEAELQYIFGQKNSIIVHRAPNLSIANAERQNMKGFRTKKTIKIILRTCKGLIEQFSRKRARSHDIIQFGEKNQ